MTGLNPSSTAPGWVDHRNDLILVLQLHLEDEFDFQPTLLDFPEA